MNHLFAAELFQLERAELARRLRRDRHAATVRATRTTSRRRTAR